MTYAIIGQCSHGHPWGECCELTLAPLASPNLIVTVIDLPMPPSTNRIWRRGKARIFTSSEYTDWKARADMTAIANRNRGQFKTILGKFTAEILLNETMGRGDADNRIKALLDWAQSRELILNDRHCRRITVEWTSHGCPEGCRLTLRELAK
jgi:Holliday junction resolvase RusA-like endonuclease